MSPTRNVMLCWFLACSVAAQKTPDGGSYPYGLGYGASYPYEGYGGLSDGGFVIPVYNYHVGGLGYGRYGAIGGPGEHPYGRRYYSQTQDQNQKYYNR